MKTASLRLLLATLSAGALGGLFSFYLILRLNPQVPLSGRNLCLGFFFWMSWGALIVGLPLWLLSSLTRRFFARRGTSIGDALALLLWLVTFCSALLFWLNASIHPEFVSRTIQRHLQQDAGIWMAASFLLILLWRLWRHHGRKPSLGVLLVLLLFTLPLLRLKVVPPENRRQEKIPARPLSAGSRRALVCGIEGLDLGFLKGRGSGIPLSALPRLHEEGSFGALRAFRPFLRPALWTTVITGTLPRRHGVTSATVWSIPRLSSTSLHLLPWTPNGSRLFIPWGLGRRVPSPPPAAPALFELLGGNAHESVVISWPGYTGEVLPRNPGDDGNSELLDEIRNFLGNAFPKTRDPILSAIEMDRHRVAAAGTALQDGLGPVFLCLNSLALSRRLLEPHGPGEARRREALGLILEFLDSSIGSLLDDAGTEIPVVILSPYGMAPPDTYERFKRILGSGKHWRAGAVSAPDGLLVLSGPGVRRGCEFSRVRMEDVAPTLCYLLKLPIPQYMEGKVVLDAIDPGWAAEHPLRVVDVAGETPAEPATGLSGTASAE